MKMSAIKDIRGEEGEGKSWWERENEDRKRKKRSGLRENG